MADQLLSGSFIPTTQSLEIGQIAELDIKPDLKEVLIRLYLDLNRAYIDLNNKETAIYSPQMFVTGGQIPFADSFTQNSQGRAVFSVTYEADVLATGATSIPLGFTVGPTWRFVTMYGAATNETTGNHYPLPFASAGGAANIQLRLTNTTIEITNNSGQAFLGLIVVIKFVQQLPA